MVNGVIYVFFECTYIYGKNNIILYGCDKKDNFYYKMYIYERQRPSYSAEKRISTLSKRHVFKLWQNISSSSFTVNDSILSLSSIMQSSVNDSIDSTSWLLTYSFWYFAVEAATAVSEFNVL